LEGQNARTKISSGHNSQNPTAHICNIMPTKYVYRFSYSSRDILLLSYRLCISIVLQTILHTLAGMFIRCLYVYQTSVCRSNPPSVVAKLKQKTIFRDHHIILHFTKLLSSQMWFMYHVRRTSFDHVSQVCVSAMLLFLLAGNYKLRSSVALQCHGVRATFR
jgi:hypothetical protein